MPFLIAAAKSLSYYLYKIPAPEKFSHSSSRMELFLHTIVVNFQSASWMIHQKLQKIATTRENHE